MSFVVREASLQDAQLIADLTHACWAARVDQVSDVLQETEDQVRAHLQTGGAYVLHDGDEAIGSIRWLPVDGQDRVWQTLRMGVLHSYAGHGLSQHLLEAVIHHALSAGVYELRLAVPRTQQRLLDFYAAYGFEVAPELEFDADAPIESTPIVMRRQLGH